MNKHLAPIALSVGLLGIVGGVAAANAFSPSEKPAQRQVEVVQPASEVVTPEPVTTTTATPVKAPVPAKVKAPAVPLVKAPATTQQRQAAVSEPQTEPETSPTPPKVKWGAGGRPTDQVGGVGVTTSPDAPEAPKAK